MPKLAQVVDGWGNNAGWSPPQHGGRDPVASSEIHWWNTLGQSSLSLQPKSWLLCLREFHNKPITDAVLTGITLDHLTVSGFHIFSAETCLRENRVFHWTLVVSRDARIARAGAVRCSRDHLRAVLSCLSHDSRYILPSGRHNYRPTEV